MATRSLAVVVSLGLVGAALFGSAPPRASTAQISGSELASELVVRSADLPPSIAWTSQPTGPVFVAGGGGFVRCMDDGGPGGFVSHDPFGLTGIVKGTVVQSIQAPTFVKKDSNGEPNVTSTVTVMKNPRFALGDLAAFATGRFLGCMRSLDAAAGLKGTVGSIKVPRLGAGNGGVGIRFVGTFPAFGKAYADAYFYIEQNVEIELSFTNGSSPFPRAWEWAIAAKVMQRAKVLMAA